MTAGIHFTPERAVRLKEAGLDHVQVSVQSPDPEENDRIAGTRSFEKKMVAARAARELRFPLTINCVLHRHNLDRIEEILALAEELDAQRLELANTQYYGWAALNQQALMPTREQLERGEEAVQRFRERVGPRINVLWVLPDYYEDLPKPCVGGWGRTLILVAPNGEAMPCHAASTIPGLEFPNVREHSLGWIWNESDVFSSSAAPTGCRSRAGRARSGARRRTSAAAAARRCGSPATPRPPIPCAGSRRTMTSWSPPARRRRARSSSTGRRGAGVGQATGELHEHPHAVAARPAADRVAAVVVEQRGPEHVDVRPRPLAREALEERRGEDRIAEALAGRVAHVGDGGLEHPAIARVQRPRPGQVAGRVAGVDDRVAPRVVVGEHAPVEVAHARSDRAGQRREVDDAGRASRARVKEGVGEDEPALRIRVGDLDGEAGGRPDHVGRPDRVRAEQVLAGREDPQDRDGSSSSAIAPSAASTAAPPAMSAF